VHFVNFMVLFLAGSYGCRLIRSKHRTTASIKSHPVLPNWPAWLLPSGAKRARL